MRSLNAQHLWIHSGPCIRLPGSVVRRGPSIFKLVQLDPSKDCRLLQLSVIEAQEIS